MSLTSSYLSSACDETVTVVVTVLIFVLFCILSTLFSLLEILPMAIWVAFSEAYCKETNHIVQNPKSCACVKIAAD